MEEGRRLIVSFCCQKMAANIHTMLVLIFRVVGVCDDKLNQKMFFCPFCGKPIEIDVPAGMKKQ